MRPRLSIVVPFFDVGDDVGPCLDSIARQTFTDFEAILVDDGSRDHSIDVARRFAEADARFRIVRQDNQGLGPARNTGMAEATGEYLAFVDSDDLVTRHGFEMLIRSLDSSGSSFAAGDARRFNSAGVRESWTHRVAFAKDRTCTHILEFGELTFDRMIWNKVFRHDFWREHEFSFPAIRYEDYPVTLPAHVEAVSVDCLATPVYYWRERESGESITQQSHHYANLADRVTSAELVLDYVEDHAPTLAPWVNRHLAQIDLVALVQAFADDVSRDNEHDLIELGHRFARRLDPATLENSSAYDTLQIHALRSGDVSLLRRLAVFRADGGLRGGVRAHRPPHRPHRYDNAFPGFDEIPKPAPRQLYRFDPRGFVLDSTVDDIRWSGDRLVIRGTAEIRHLATSPRSRLSISLVGSDFSRPCRLSRFEALDAHGESRLVGFEVEIDLGDIAAAPPTSLHFLVDMRDHMVHRTAPLRGLRTGSPSYPAGRWDDGPTWVQPARGGDGRLQIWRYADPWAVSAIEIRDDHIEIRGRAPMLSDRSTRMTLARSTAAAGLPVDFRYIRAGRALMFVADVRLVDIVDAANPDDPVTERTTRVVTVHGDESTTHLVSTDVAHDVSTVVHGRMLRVTRSPGNLLNILESPVQAVASHARLSQDGAGATIELSGDEWGTGLTDGFAWRHFLPGSDDFVEVDCKRTTTDESWGASTAVGDLLEIAPVAPSGTVEWALFAVDADGDSQPVRVSQHLATQLPMSIAERGREIVLRPRSEMFHLEVR